MRKSNIIIKKVRNLMILSMAVIVIISVYFNILNSRAKETTDIVANVTDETGEIDSQKVTLVATGNKNGNYEISLPETISNVYVSNYKTLNGDKSANDKIVLSQDEVENKEINLEVNYDKKNVTSTKTNEEMTLYKQNLEYDDKGIYVEGYMPLLAQINVIQNENDISLEILYTVVESNNMSTKEIYVPSEYEQTLKITLNKKKYGVEQSLISSTDAEYIVVEQSNSKLVINNISSNTINITNEEVPTIISSQYNGEDNKYYFAGGPIANSQIESIKFVTNPKEVLGTKWDASENGDNSVIAGYIDSNGNELYEIYVASNSDKTTKVYTPEDASYMFYECSNLTTIDIQNLGTSKTTNMNSMFAMCTNITTLELQNFDTSNVEDMENMFFGCENLETLDISNFITAKVTTMCNMFQNCKKLTELNLESFDTSKVIDMNSMFNGCESLTILNLNNFNTTEVTDMSWMFYNCKNITTLDLSNFDTSNVIDMSAMFSTCENLTTLNISNFNTTEVTSMNAMFSDCKKLQILNISNFNISKVEDMSFMFSGCIKLSELDLGKQFTKIANENEGIFDGLEENQLVIKVPSAIYAGKNEIKLNNGSTDIITFLDNVKVECKYKIEWKKVSSSVDIAQKQINVVLQAEGVNTTYDSAKILTDGISKYLQLYIDGKIVDNLTVTIENQEVKNGKLQCTLKIKNEEIKDGEGMALVIKEDSATDKYGNGNLEIKLIITEPLPIMQNTQYNGDDNKYYFAGGTIENSKIESIKFVASKEEVLGTQWDASKNGNNSVIAGYVDSNNNGLYEIYVASNSEKTTKVYMPEDASYMFYEGNNLTTIDLQNINTSKTINMNSMFAICNNLTTLNLSSFDTSKVIDMENMFYKNEKLVTLDISSFNTSEVTTMSNMFSNCTSLTKLDLNNFNTSKVTDMNSMFFECRNLATLNISNFNTSQVTNMSYMFCNCSSLRSIYVSEYNETTGKGWTTKNVTDSDNMFTGATKLVGGNGTVYNSSYIDATYARIDKEAEPGYLTKSVKGTTFDKDEKIFISGEAVTIPAGMTVSSFKGEFESIDQGIVIYRLNGDVPDWTNKTKMQETYDQFVWVPVKNAILDLSSTYSGLDYAGLISKVQEQINVGKYPMAIKTNTAGDYIGVLYEFSEVTENNTTYVKVIPNSKWKPKSKKANLNYIEMDSKREPGGLTSSTYGDTETNLKQINGILNTSYNSTTSFKSALQSQYNEMVKKVEEKGGFWVGRYETSSMSNSTTENYIASNRIQVSSKRNTTNGIGDVTWYKMYAQQKIYSELALESKTTSSMIWGSQYDQIMIWMKGEKSSDQASSRGKYYVTNGAGKGNYGTISGVENDVYSGIAPTGSQDIYSIKNIFDLAGNVFEWSLEASMTAFRVERGGSYYDTDAYYTRPDDRYSQRPSYP